MDNRSSGDMGSSPEESHKIEIWLAAFEQNWFHARHAENERLTLTSIVAAIVGALVGWFYKAEPLERDAMRYPVFAFVLVLGLFGLLLCNRFRVVFSDHMEKIKMLCDQQDIASAVSLRADEIKYPKRLGVNWLFIWLFLALVLYAAGMLCVPWLPGWLRSLFP